MSETTPQRSVLWPALRRFWPVALLTAAVAGVSASLLVEATAEPTVVADASYVVPVAAPVTPLVPGQLPVAPSPLPASPGAASDFAEVYAVLLTEDGTVREALSQASGIPPEDLGDQIQALAVNGGSVVKVSVTGRTRTEVAAVLDSLDALFSAPEGATPNIPAGNLVPLRRGTVVESDGLAPLAPVVGVIVGLLLGVGAAVVLERGDSRFRSGDDVRALVPWPVLALSHDPDDPRAEVLAERVRRAGTDLRTVALVAPRGARPSDLEDLAWVLEEADRHHAADGGVTWSVAGVLRGEGDTEQRAQDADALVLVVPAKARMRHVTAAVQAVEDLAVHPVVVALPSTRSRRARASTRFAGSGAGPAVGFVDSTGDVAPVAPASSLSRGGAGADPRTGRVPGADGGATSSDTFSGGR